MPSRAAVAMLFLGCAAFLSSPIEAVQEIRLRTLGLGRTSFNVRLKTPEDLRRMIQRRARDMELVLQRKDIAWPGRIEDIVQASKTAPIDVIAIPPEEAIPWMAMRRGGRPAALTSDKRIIWAGPNPIQAFTFQFASQGSSWRLIAPQPCGNFWVVRDEDPGSSRLASRAATSSSCFQEDVQIQFAPAGAPFGREGLIQHDDGFGDTSQREGWYWLGVKILGRASDTPPRVLTFADTIKKLEPEGNGVFLRAPGKDPFGRPLDGFENHGTTRDQLVPMIVAMAAWGRRDELQRLWHALPEDIAGKHDFQGHWHDVATGANSYVLDPVNDIKNRVCLLSEDTRNCEPDWSCDCKWYDPRCSKVACEIGKGLSRAACEASKGTQNGIYKAQQAACEVGKAAEIVATTAKKQTGLLHFTGDPLPPTAYNLFVRAGVTPFSIFPTTLWLVSPAGFAAGELNLKLQVDTLRHQATGQVKCGSQEKADPLDCVDQDMNTIAMLWMGRERLRNPVSESAIASYRSRAHSYGSYFDTYCKLYGPLVVYEKCPSWEPNCCTTKECLSDRVTSRIASGIASGRWQPDPGVSGAYGAVRWYNRWVAKANPRLATMWEPIIKEMLSR